MTRDDVDRRLLERVQRDFPLVERPFAALGEELGVPEAEVLERLARLQESGLVRRLGPVFDPARLGYVTTLCGARVVPGKLEAVAACVSALPEVTHNYAREGAWNLWFTLNAPTEARIDECVVALRGLDGVERLESFPSEKTFKIRVHFTMTEPR
jgi:DNA-binding Lrp family transcriptional regulator